MMTAKTKTAIVWILSIILPLGILILILWSFRKKIFKKYYARKDTDSAPVVSYGDKGDAVLALQRALNKCWQNTLKEDGDLGPKTEAAINKAGYQLPMLKTSYAEVINKC